MPFVTMPRPGDSSGYGFERVRIGALAGGRRVVAAVLAIAVMGLTLGVVAAGPASAAPGDPFDTTIPQLFLAQDPDGDGQEQLLRAVVQPDGTVSYLPEGGEVPFAYNAIGFNSSDGFIYAVEALTGRVLKVGQAGVVTVTAITLPATNQGNGSRQSGTMSGTTYYTMCQGCTSLLSTNVVTGASSTINLTGVDTSVPRPADFTLAGGMLWGVDGTRRIVRINPNTGAVTYFAGTSFFPNDSSPYGAAWTFGNGTPSFQNNLTGDFYQLSIANPTSANPTFTLLSVKNASPSTANDGTAAPGSPTDLAIDKIGPTAYVPGNTITYQLKVTNNGAGTSSGSVVTDTLPATLSNPTTPSANCSITGQTLTCIGPPLAVGASYSVTVSATVSAGATAAIPNTATVLANEADNTSGNNSDSSSAVATPAGPIACGPVYALQRGGNHLIYRVNTSSGQMSAAGAFGTSSLDPDMNGLALTSTGVAYGFLRTSPPSPLPILRFDPASGLTTQVGSITTVGGRQAIMGGFDPSTGWYWVGIFNPDLGRLEFYAFDTTTNTSLGLQFTMPDISGDPGVVVPNGDLAFDSQGRMYVVLSYGDGFSTSNRIVVFDTVPTDGRSHSGTRLTYLQPNSASFVGIAFGSDGYLYTTAHNASFTADAIYQLNPTTGALVSSRTLLNPDGSVATDIIDLASCASPFTLTLQKNIAGRAASGDQFRLAITGNGVTTNNTGLTSGSTTGLQTDDPATAGPILVRPGQPYTISETGANGANLANYATTYQCVDRAHNNTVVTSGSTASGTVTIPTTTDGSGADIVCTITNTPKTPGLSLVKSAALSTDTNQDGLAGVGDEVTFSFTVRNTGAVTLRDVRINDPRLTNLGLSANCPDTTLAPGETVVCTSSVYLVTQADVNAGAVVNVATSTGTAPNDHDVTSPPSTVSIDTERDWVGSVLAFTGSNTSQIVGFALALLCLGIFLQLLQRRSALRRNQTPIKKVNGKS